MKLHFSWLLVLVILLATSASADVIYTNGAINGNINAYSFTGQYGWEMADSFTVSVATTIGGFDAGVWVFPGDEPASVHWEILTGGPDWLGGTIVAQGDANFSNVFWGLGFGYYSVFTSSVSGLNLNLGPGDYWLELVNGTASTPGDPVYWDENDGPSQAHQGRYGSEYGQVGSEAFTVYGTSTSGGGGSPEPGTLILFGTGVVGLAGLVGRRLGR